LGLLPQSRLTRVPGFRLIGVLETSAGHQEEGYFVLGRDFSLMCRPKSGAHYALAQLVGKKVSVQIDEHVA